MTGVAVGRILDSTGDSHIMVTKVRGDIMTLGRTVGVGADHAVGLVVMVDAAKRTRFDCAKIKVMTGGTGLGVGDRVGRTTVGDDLGCTVNTVEVSLPPFASS